MRQLVQNFKTGELKLEQVPLPIVLAGQVLVCNSFSLISAGTEKATVSVGKQSLLGKAKSRPDLVKQVLANLRKEGLAATLDKVQNKLDTPKALGYSTSGVVVASEDFAYGFKPGDRVACAGQDYASHAEYVTVPQNLVALIPENVSLEEAAFTTLGAIALQGVRQADLKLGEKVAVIGLGLLGQLTFQLVNASGCSVFGLDVSDSALKVAQGYGYGQVAKINDPAVLAAVERFSAGFGFDKVIITASTSDNSPITFACETLRKKGLMVIVGNVKMDIPREPHFYRKELELKIATSYGPGRYDPCYEQAGIDYPYGYVRFTENRNMQSFLELVAKGAIKLKNLITHQFDFAQALSAYDLILGKRQEPYLGILLKYNQNQIKQNTASSLQFSAKSVKAVNIGFVGAGNFATSYLLPQLKYTESSLDTVVTLEAIAAKSVAAKFGFSAASCDPRDVFNSEKINTVFVATRHNSHAEYVVKALAVGKNVFVEKPLALNLAQLKEVIRAYNGKSILLCGFNRRFSAAACQIKAALGKNAAAILMNFRVNAGYIAPDSWIQDIDVGGGRIIGEVCHFVDLASFFAASAPKRVFATAANNLAVPAQLADNLTINLEFANGSSANIVYTSCGAALMPKEQIEVFSAGNSYLINDFKETIFYGKSIKKIQNQGKGHKEEVAEFIRAVKSGGPSPIEFKSLLATTLTTFKIVESLNERQAKEVDIAQLYE